MVHTLAQTVTRQNEAITRDFIRSHKNTGKYIQQMMTSIVTEGVRFRMSMRNYAADIRFHTHLDVNAAVISAEDLIKQLEFKVSSIAFLISLLLFVQMMPKLDMAIREGKGIARAPLPDFSSDSDDEIDTGVLSGPEDAQLIAVLKESKAMDFGKIPPHRPPKEGKGPSTRASSILESSVGTFDGLGDFMQLQPESDTPAVGGRVQEIISQMDQLMPSVPRFVDPLKTRY
ncbi:hypothetical protein OSB04_019638 [Centaurea solstitialis]|uniref:Uncharacterized protein n=1 Tax=Centaurea solstitialis TaxID=347529 RepID=A0AA38SQP6_9ASTR|nr:hypothetical protein OSB04_019638 [Centaurea solstitialis]